MTDTKEIGKIMEILEKHFSSTGRTTLNVMRKNPNPFRILIACLLSLRARDENTDKVAARLFKIADTPKEIIKIPIKKLEKIIYSSGYYKNKARTLKSVSKEILERFEGRVPNNKESLLSIKGVGPKTANIVLSFAFNQCVLPIDTHCHRIPNRLEWVKTKTPEKTEAELEKILPKKYWCEFNGIFVLFGRTICQPVSPFCSKCPIREYCPRIGVKRSR